MTATPTVASAVDAVRDRLAVRGVTKRFGGVTAVDDVTFTARAGEIYGIIGSNGAGKSTLLGVISGAHTPSGGTVELDGVTISGRSAAGAARHGVGRAHQVPRPFRDMTVRQHADLAARRHLRSSRRRADYVDHVLERCGLADRQRRLARDLGLLDLKRLEVARALALAPKVMLLDEVAAGLVGQEVDELIELIGEIHDAVSTIIIVEHVQALIRQLAERVLVLEQGRMLVEGTPHDVANDERVIDAYLGRTESKAPALLATGAVGRSDRDASAERPEPVIEVGDLDVAYGLQLALRGCSLSVGRGEVVAVVGANGAGKTTLSRAIAGMVPSRRGSIKLCGDDITTLAAHRRSRGGVALCHEGRRLFTEQTVDENLRIAARHAATDSPPPVPDQLATAYDLFPELRDLRNQLTGSLSGGEQQMVAIARALVLEPKVVIFDELSLGLAPLIVDRLFEAIAALRGRGLAILLIEQEVNRALSVADHVEVLDRGSIVFSGSPTDALHDHRLRAAYLGAASDPRNQKGQSNR